MTAIEAIIYCLGYVGDIPDDGYFISQVVYDKHGDSHWISWECVEGAMASPRFCSSSCWEFSKSLEPYRMTREQPHGN